MTWWHTFLVETVAFLGLALTLTTIPWILATKKEPTSAVAWCLIVFFVPYLGSMLFFILGYQHVQLHVRRKKRHRRRFREAHPIAAQEADPETPPEPGDPWQPLVRLAQHFDAFPVTAGNSVCFYHEGAPAYEAMIEAIGAARHHIHLETFIFQPDATGRRFVEVLAGKAREGVEVRLLYDAMGSHRLDQATLRPLLQAGGKASAFLPLSPLRRRLQVNLRNHRKILVVDGRTAFAGGLNVGDEYLGEVQRFGFWRDTHLHLEGPAVAGLQYVFLEDWDFASGEHLHGPTYYPDSKPDGDTAVQVVFSGPDQQGKTIREVYFAAILRARRRLWIASPYFVPDSGLRDALCLAGYLGVDVRLLCQYHPDKWVPFFAGRYYWADVLNAGVKVYQYTRGMMHSKVLLVDGEWASVGSANLDNRSLHLNFETNCLFYSSNVAAELERAFLKDLAVSIRLKQSAFCRRSFAVRMVENGCRLLSPIL